MIVALETWGEFCFCCEVIPTIFLLHFGDGPEQS